jgi:membrane protein DedA with SNARE-associated domain
LKYFKHWFSCFVLLSKKTMEENNRMKFLIKNGLKGIAWLAVLLLAYFLFDWLVISKNPDAWVERFYAKPIIVYSIYLGSEFFFGLFPPELFMIWAYNKSDTAHYILNVSFFAAVSYAMGYLTFLIGQFLHKRISFRYVRRKFLTQQAPLLKKYGLFMIIVAAMTPLPWSAVCLLVGSSGFSSGKFLKYALFRVLRFVIYGFIVFQSHQF